MINQPVGKAYLKEMVAKVRKIRDSNKMTVRDLGVICGLDYSSLCRVELGEYHSRILTLKIIADVLCVDLKEFLQFFIMENKPPEEAINLFENIVKAFVKNNPKSKAKRKTKVNGKTKK